MSSSNFSELKSRIVEWNIDDEKALINKIQSFTNDYTNQCNSISTNLNNFSHNLDIVEIDFYNSMNSLKTISLHKFIEHVIDEDEPLKDNTNTEEEPKILTAEERNNYQVQLIKNAVDISVNAIPVKEPKQAQQPGEENSEDDTASVASSRLLGNQITHFKKLKLPYLINSKDFMMTEYVGLVPEEKEEVQNEEKMNVTDAMRQVNNQGGNENEREFIPIDNGDSNNNNQYMQQQDNNQQPPQYNYQQPQSVPVQPSMGKGGIPVPPPMNLKVPKTQPNNNVQNNNQKQMMNPVQQKPPIQNEQPADVRTMLMRQMQQRNNPQPQNNMSNDNEVQQNNSQYVNARPVENNLFQSKTMVQNQMPNRVMRTGTVYNNGKKEVRLGDFVKGKSIFDDEDDEEDDDFDPTMRSKTIVDKNKFRQKPPMMNPNPQMMNPNPQMMNPNPQMIRPNPQMMNPQQMVQQQLQEQLMNQQKGSQMKVEPKLPVKEEKKSNNLFEMDNDDVPNNIPMKQPKTANTKKLGANLAKIFGDDEEEEEENLEVTKIEEKTKNIAEKLNQLSKKEEPKLPPKEIKKPSFFEEEEDKKLPIKKEEIKKPEKGIKRPTFFDDDEEDVKPPVKEIKPEPQKQIQNVNSNAPKKKVNLFDPLGGDPVQEVRHAPSKSVVGNVPLPKKKNTFSIFEEEEESNDKPIEVKLSNPIVQKEPPKQKRGLLFGDEEEELPKEKPVIKEPEKEIKPKVEMFPQRKKTEPEKKLNAFEKMLEQKKQDELEKQKKKDEVQIKKADFNSRISGLQNLLSGRLSNAVDGSAFMMNPEARIQSVAQEEVNNENPNPSSDVNNDGENKNPEEIKAPEPEKKLEQTLSTQKVIQKKKPKKKAFGLPPSNEDKPKPAPSNLQQEEAKKVPVSNPQPQVVNKPINLAPAKKKPQKNNIDPLSNMSSSTTTSMRKSEVFTHQKAITNDPLSILGGNDLQSHRKTMVTQQKTEIKKPNLKTLFDEDEDIDILSSNQPKVSQTHAKAASTAMFNTNTFGKSTSNDSNMRDSIFSSQKRMSNIFGDEEDDRLSIRISSLPQPTNNPQPQRQPSNTITSSITSNKPKPNDKRLQFLFDDDD